VSNEDFIVRADLPLRNDERKIISEFVRRVRETFDERVRRIILYGSRARRDHEEESDYDFIVLLNRVEPDDKKRLKDIAWEISYEHNTVIMPLLIAEANFREDRYFYLYENVCKEGIDL